jgi:Fe-S-cluster containining protein
VSEMPLEELNIEVAETYPVLRDDFVVEPVEGKQGELRVVGQDIILGEAALAIARQFNGARTCQQITDDLLEHNVRLPSGDFVEALALALARVGLVRMVARPRLAKDAPPLPDDPVALHTLAHICVGCGRSCQGHVVGPLEEAYVERLKGLHAALEAEFPDLVGLSPIRVERFKEKEITALAVREDGTCIYLGDDKLCRIHKKFGSAAKPMVCRLYPLNLVQTEDAVRVGTPLRCYMHHKSYRGEGMSPVEMTGMEPEEFPANTRRGMDANDRHKVLPLEEADGSYLRTLRMEEMLMRLLQREEVTVEALWRFTYDASMGQRLEAMSGLSAESTFLKVLTWRFNRMGHRMSVGLKHIFDISDDVSHAAEIQKLANFMRDFTPRDFQGLTPMQKDFGLYVMREWFFLREWVLQPSFYVALPVMLAGLMLASWRAEAAGEVDDGEEVGDVFAFSLATWMRLVRIGTNLVMFIRNEEEFRDLLIALEAPAAPPA